MVSVDIFLLIFFLTLTDANSNLSWECKNGNCLKTTTENSADAVSLAACRIFCDAHNSLWPRVSGNITIGNTLIHLNPNSIDVIAKQMDTPSGKLVQQAGMRFKTNIQHMIPPSQNPIGGRSLEISVDIVQTDIISLSLETDESYSLSLKQTTDGRIAAEIKADTFFGARHGLETLGQLIIYDDIRNEILIVGEIITHEKDKPAFPYRGILLDTARNYISVETIKRTIEGMATSKLNSFHWHITDTHSFPFVSKSNPDLSKIGAYSPYKIYTPKDISDIVEYARIRGVRVIPEFDAPAHVGEGWQDTGLVACFNAQPWGKYCVEPPCGQLDPTQDKLYDILSGIYADMIEVFQPNIFHMGGDEVSLSCWNSTDNIVKWMTEHQNWQRNEEDFMKLWNVFQSQAKERLEKKLGKKIPLVMWTSTLTKPDYVEQYLPKDDYIIQIWTAGFDPVVRQLLNKGYRLILSNYDSLYLDCGFEGWVTDGNNWCSPYIGWQKVYNNSPQKIVGADKIKQVLGNEAALWTEQVDDTTVDSRLWPRAAAMAETLWTAPTEGWRAAENRMLIHRNRLVERGIMASGMQPEWCMHQQGQCPA